MDYLTRRGEGIEDWLKGSSGAQTEAIVDFFERYLFGRKLGCDSEAIMCKKRKRSLASAAWIVEGWGLIAFIFFKLIGATSFGLGLFFTIQISVLIPAILALAYDFPVSCFPRLPVCLGDDLFDLTLTVFPEHISWPSRIVSNVTRGAPEGISTLPWMQQLEKETSIRDCEDYHFTGFFDPFYWFREYLDASWFSVVEWPLSNFLEAAHEKSEKWKNIELTPTINQCGILNALGIIAPIIFSFFFYLALTFVTVPAFRTFVRTVKRAIPNVRRTVVDMLHISNQ